MTLMFCLGDINAATESPTGQPYIEVVLNATGSVAATTVLAIVIVVAQVIASEDLTQHECGGTGDKSGRGRGCDRETYAILA